MLGADASAPAPDVMLAPGTKTGSTGLGPRRLVTGTDDSGRARYVIHDLVRLFARAQPCSAQA